VAARCAALTADDADAEALWREAIAAHEGMAARSSRHAPGCCTASGCVATGARGHLLAAATAFARMGARPWRERAEAELRAGR